METPYGRDQLIVSRRMTPEEVEFGENVEL